MKRGLDGSSLHPLCTPDPGHESARTFRAPVAEPLSSRGAGAAVLMGVTHQGHTQGMSLNDNRLAVTLAQGCLDKGVQDPCPSWHYSPQHAVSSAALAGTQCSMPGPVVLPSKNAILDFFCAGCSPIFCSSKRLPSHGLAGSAQGIAAVPGARSSQHVPRASAALVRPARSRAGGPGTPSCGCRVQQVLPGSQKLPALLPAPCHGLAPLPAGLCSIAPTAPTAGSHEWAPSASTGAPCSQAPEQWPYTPLPSVTWCPAGGPWGQQGLSGCPTLPTDT